MALAMDSFDQIFEDVTRRIDGLSGFQIKSVTSSGGYTHKRIQIMRPNCLQAKRFAKGLGDKDFPVHKMKAKLTTRPSSG